MKYSPEYHDEIKEIVFDPFFLIFWSQSQKFVYSQINKRGRTCISMDATGGLVSNDGMLPYTESGKKISLPHIFLYLICVKNENGKSIPVAQMLSAQQDTKKINYFLERFSEEFQCPDEVVVDDSAALLKSCANVFGRCINIDEYLGKCFNVLDIGDIQRLPKCFIRLDVAHFVKNLHKSKVFSDVGYQVKHFYLSIIGGILQTSSFDAIREIIRHMLIIANYPLEGTLCDGYVLPTAESRIFLQRFIRSHDIEFAIKEFRQADGEILKEEGAEVYEDLVENSNCQEWFANCCENILYDVNSIDASPVNLTSNSTINHYCCPTVNNFLRKLVLRLPLWSFVMKDHFKSTAPTGISGDVESRFNLIKNNVFKNFNLPTNIEIFVKRMLDEVKAVAKLNCLLLPTTDEEISSLKEDVQSDSVNVICENDKSDFHEIPNLKEDIQSDSTSTISGDDKSSFHGFSSSKEDVKFDIANTICENEKSEVIFPKSLFSLLV